jgi:hypothetical protein
MEMQNRKFHLLSFSSLSFEVSPFKYLHLFLRSFEDFEILHGDMQGLADTMAFLTSLSGLVGNDPRSPEKQSRERTAASVLFDLEVCSSVCPMSE